MLCYKLKVILWYDFFKFYTLCLYLIYMADIFIWDNDLARIDTLRLRLKVKQVKNIYNYLYKNVYFIVNFCYNI